MKTLERSFGWLVLAPVALPLIVVPGIVYPFLVPKTLLFYAVSLVTLAAFLLLITHGTQLYWGRLVRWETWVPAALLALASATSMVGIDMYRSVWSLFVRGDGLLLLAGVTTSFYLILLTADRTFLHRLTHGVAIVGTSLALYGIGEWLVNGGRVGSLLGNAAFFAGYLGMAFWITLFVAGDYRGQWRRAIYFAAALQVVAVVLTATRGTLLALVIAGSAYLSYLIVRGGGERVWASRLLIGLLILGGGFFFMRAQLATIPFEPVARFAAISTTDIDVASRLFIWKNTLAATKPHLLTGVGAEHVDVLFNQFYDPTLITEQWFDRSHNAFLDYLVQYGIGGLLLYCVLIGAFIRTAWRLLRSGERRLGGLAALLILTYAVQNFFVFDTVSSLWLLLAFFAVLLSSAGPSSREVLPLPSWMRPASWLVALILVGLIYPVSVLPAAAAYDLARAYNYQIVDVSKEVSYLSHGFALGTYADIEYGYEAYDMYANSQIGAKLSLQDRTDAYQAALSILKTNFNRYTYDARTALYLAHVLSLAPSGVEIDSTLLSASLERAIRLSPKRSQSWYILANLSLNSANQYPAGSPERAAGYNAAQDILTQYIKMVPTLSMPHFVLAQLLYADGKKEAAALEAAKGKQSYKEDLETASRAAVYYENSVDPVNPALVDLQNAAFFLSEVVKLNPTNVTAQGDLNKIKAYVQSK